MIGIDDVGQRGGFRHDRQPSEGVGFLVDARQISGDGLAAGAVKTVAPCDVVAVYAVFFAIFCKGDIGGIRGQFVGLNAFSLVDDVSARLVASGIQVFGNCRLAIGGHVPAGVFPGVDQQLFTAGPGDIRAVMGLALTVQSFAEPY